MTDKERILERLREGPVTSLEIRWDLRSGNPSERIRELKADGYLIESEDFTYRDRDGTSRRATRYQFVGGAEQRQPVGEAAPDEAAAVVEGGERSYSAAPVPATLFEVPEDELSYYEQEAA